MLTIHERLHRSTSALGRTYIYYILCLIQVYEKIGQAVIELQYYGVLRGMRRKGCLPQMNDCTVQLVLWGVYIYYIYSV